MTIVEVDFNNIDGSGHVRVFPSAVTASLSIGDQVTAVDRLEDLEFEGVVVERLGDGGVALAMEWEPVAQLSGLRVSFTLTDSSSFFVGAPISYGCLFAKEPVVTVVATRVSASVSSRPLATAR